MKQPWNNYFRLMDAAGEGTGGGGAGSGEAGANGSLINAGQGNQGAAQAGGAGAASGGSGGASGTGANNAASGNAATDWRSSLPQELQEDATIKKFTSVHALAGAYINAQKLIGGEKIPVPGAATTDEQWKDIYRKLGVPEKLEDYKVSFKEPAAIEEVFTKAFQEKAHTLGILPKQAQALADWFSDSTIANQQKMLTDTKTAFDTTVANLKKTWGNAFELNVARANKVVMELGGQELSDHIAKSGLGADEKVVQLLAKMGEKLYKEDKFVEGQGSAGAMSPKELDAEIGKLKAHPAYFEKTHPQHKAIVAEMQDLFKKRYNS